MNSENIQYLIFDIESIVDAELVAKVKFPGESIDPQIALERYVAERLDKYGTEFIPYTYHVPISVAIAKVTSDFRLQELVTLDAPEFRPHIITEHFWRGWYQYHMPTLVTFNGRSFDIPLLELSAYRFGIGIPHWFNISERAYDQHRNRYNATSHLDIQDLMTNFGASKLAGGLHLLANIIGKPGKMEVSGSMVQELYQQGRLDEINDYCRCDVLDTYFVFLRMSVMLGRLTLEQELEIVEEMCRWLEEQQEAFPIYGKYRERMTDWANPWTNAEGKLFT